MAKIDRVQEVSLELLRPYEKNAKIHTPEQVEKIANSIKEFGFLSPVLIDKDFGIIRGHGRVLRAKKLGLGQIPCLYIEGLTDAQKRAYILADNKLAELGEWDLDTLSEELAELQAEGFDIDLAGFEVKADFFTDRKRWDNSREEGNDEYNEFLEKFKPKRTTDDCYTPDNIYDALRQWVADTYGLKCETFIRPFYPGGDYQAEDYVGKIVVDNPPFSILSEIVNFYNENGVRYFLFAPAVALFNYIDRCSVLTTFNEITFENGARVNVSFLTNLEPKKCARTTPELSKKLRKINKENSKTMSKQLPIYSFPDEIVTRAIMGKWSKYGIDVCFYDDEFVTINALDSMKAQGKVIYGRGLLLSERAAAERAAAERAAAERAAAIKWELSEKEREIVRSLGAKG